MIFMKNFRYIDYTNVYSRIIWCEMINYFSYQENSITTTNSLFKIHLIVKILKYLF